MISVPLRPPPGSTSTSSPCSPTARPTEALEPAREVWRLSFMRDGRWRWVAVAVAAVGVGCGVVGLPGSSRGPVEVMDARAGPREAALLLGVASCRGDPAATIHESTVEVRVQVVAAVPRGTGPDCQDVVEITLEAPLGSRRLVDERSGHPVELIGGASAGIPPTTEPVAGALAVGPLEAREGHVAVWTGEEMVVWGGALTGEPSALPPLAGDGAAYDPGTGTWRALTPSPLSPRSDAEVVWTGQEMVVWGGNDGANQPLRDGARYHPADDTWHLLPTGGPADRPYAQLEWTGEELIVFGGEFGRADAARMAPDGDAWTAIPAAPFEGADDVHATWAGDRLVVLADHYDDRTTVRMSAWDLSTNAWTPPADTLLATGWAAGARWDGERLLVLNPGQGLADGTATSAALDPTTGAWTPVAEAPPGAHGEGPTVWTGEAVVFAGTGSDDAAAYDPVTDSWRALASAAEGRRHQASAVWADGAVLVWGGNASYEGRSLRADGSALVP